MTGSSSAAPTADALERVLAFMRAGAVRTADSARPIRGGLLLTTPSLQAVWSLNHVRVSEALPFEALVALADEQLAGLDYRQIVIEDQRAGRRLEDAFRAAGWKVDVDLVMTLTCRPDRAPDPSVRVDGAEEDEVLEVMRRWHAEGADTDPEELAQLVASTRREARAHGDRLLGVRSSDGRLVAITKLRGDGSTAQVEDVYTVPEARGRGFARALVTRATELARDAGHDLIFIVADDHDWPKLLYGRLGFAPLGRMWQLHRG